MTLITGFDLCRAALAVDGITAPEQSVLMVLAIMANDEAQCWPPINGPTGLTGKTKLSERAVQRAIQRLKELGHLGRKQLRHGCVYTVHPLTPATQSGVSATGDTQTPDRQAARPATVAPKLPVTTIPQKASPSSGKRASKAQPTTVPVDFLPSVDPKSITGKVMADWPPGEREEQVEHFIDRHTTQGTLSLDWQASWRTWVKNWKKFNGNRPGIPQRQTDLRGSRPQPALDMLHAARRAQAGERPAGSGGDREQAGAALPALWTG